MPAIRAFGSRNAQSAQGPAPSPAFGRYFPMNGEESRVERWEPPRLALAHDLVHGLDDALPVRLGEVVPIRSVRRPVRRGGEGPRRGVQVPPPLLRLEDLLEHER